MLVPVIALIVGGGLSVLLFRVGLRKESGFERFRAWSMAVVILACTLIASISSLFTFFRS